MGAGHGEGSGPMKVESRVTGVWEKWVLDLGAYQALAPLPRGTRLLGQPGEGTCSGIRGWAAVVQDMWWLLASQLPAHAATVQQSSATENACLIERTNLPSHSHICLLGCKSKCKRHDGV